MKFSLLSLGALALALGLAAPAPSAQAGCGGCGSQQAHAHDIVDTAIAAGSFNTLVKAVQAAGLVETLKGDGPFTVFAPTDEAFAKVPAETLSALLSDTEALTKVLTYHVVPGRVPASQVTSLQWADTANGQAARIQVRDGNVYVDNARVVKTDIETSNGIIHVIDTVILPRADIVDTAVSAGSFTTLVKAVQAADLVETLKGDGPFTVFAPADSAFAQLPQAEIQALLADKAALQRVLTFHVVPGRILAEDIQVGTIHVPTASGDEVSVIRTRDGKVMVGGARVVATDIIAGNGVIHVLDGVIFPTEVSAN